jgi:hypothetical protein
MSKHEFFEEDETINLKFRIGDSFPKKMKDLDSYTFTFAFDYLSMQNTKFCFNNPNITKEDYIKLFELKKELCNMKVADIQNIHNKKYHFHTIDLLEKTFLFNPLKKLLNVKYIDTEKFPPLFQIALYTDNEKLKAPRIIGFFGRYAIFHILLFDYGHEIYRKPNVS